MSTPELTIGAGGGRLDRRRRILGVEVDLGGILVVLAVFVTTRLLVLLTIFMSSAVIPMQSGSFGYASPDNLMIDGLIRHDSWWYINIAENGYTAGDLETSQQGTVTFFPLYPVLVKMVSGLTGDIYLAGILVSNLAFLVALFFLYGLARHEFDDATAARTIFYMAGAPSTIFFSAMYTESLFLATVCAAFYYARRRQWSYAAIAGALAAATRNTGVLMAPVIAIEGLYAAGVRLRPERWLGATPAETLQIWRAHSVAQLRLVVGSWPSLLAACYVTLGLVGYMAFLQATFGDPLAFIHAQATWGRSTSATSILNIGNNIIKNLNLGPNPWIGQISILTLLNLISTLGFLPLVIMVAVKLPPAYKVFALLTFYVPLSTGSIGSMTRYVLMLMPCFMLLAVWGRRGWVDRLVTGIFLPLTALFSILFSHWYFVG